MEEVYGPKALKPVFCSRATHTAVEAFLKEDRLKMHFGSDRAHRSLTARGGKILID